MNLVINVLLIVACLYSAVVSARAQPAPIRTMPQVQQGATPETYNTFVESPREALRAGDAAKAYSNCEAARKMAPSRFEAYIVCAGALSRLNKTEDAIGMLQMALVNSPEDKKADIRSANAQMRAVPPAAQSVVELSNASAAPTAQEIVLWKSIEATPTESDLKVYLKAYPNGAFAPLARLRLQTVMEASERIKQQVEERRRAPGCNDR